MIPRHKAGRLAGVALSVAFAAAVTLTATVGDWLGIAHPPGPGEASKITVRLPDLGSAAGSQGTATVAPGRVVVRRGEVLAPTDPRAPLLSSARPVDGRAAAARALGLFGALLLAGLLFTTFLRIGPRGRLLRLQAAVLGSFALFAVLAQVYLLLTPLSVYLLPAAALPLIVGVVADRNSGLAAAFGLALTVGALTPFDVPTATVLAVQGVAALVVFTRAKRRRAFIYSGAAAGLGAAGAYAAIYLVRVHALPVAELADPARSPLLAALAGGALAGPLALILRPALEPLYGGVSKFRLVEYTDLENRLLKRLAAEAPGTWQHSLATANMAEMAATAVGANALLARVGAYYHDVGKALQPHYYIENLAPGEPSPHEALSPMMSADAIFSHVTEGVRLAREAGLPEPLVEFIYQHHGDGLIEFFWNKCQDQGNPSKLPPGAFRYPGVRPQSREAAVVALCDAVEAASRSMREPEGRDLEGLVRRIVYGKLHDGQLDDSGLTLAELKTLANTLTEILCSSHHVRIEYPWQRSEAARGGSPGAVASAVPVSIPYFESGPVANPILKPDISTISPREAQPQLSPRPTPPPAPAPAAPVAPAPAPAVAVAAVPAPPPDAAQAEDPETGRITESMAAVEVPAEAPTPDGAAAAAPGTLLAMGPDGQLVEEEAVDTGTPRALEDVTPPDLAAPAPAPDRRRTAVRSTPVVTDEAAPPARPSLIELEAEPVPTYEVSGPPALGGGTDLSSPARTIQPAPARQAASLAPAPPDVAAQRPVVIAPRRAAAGPGAQAVPEETTDSASGPTIELLRDVPAASSPSPGRERPADTAAGAARHAAEAPAAEEELLPGLVIMGPPPATKPDAEPAAPASAAAGATSGARKRPPPPPRPASRDD